MATITMGGITLPNITACDATEVFVGTQEESHNGTLLTDYTALKLSWTIKAEMLTEAQRDTVKARTDTVTSQTLNDLDGNSYTVVVRRGSYAETRQPGNNTTDVYYSITFECEEAS